MKSLRFSALFFILTAFVFTGCQNSKKSERIDLTKGWEYTVKNPEFNPESFKNLDDSKLSELETLVPRKHGTLWLRKTFTIPESLKNEDLSAFLGRITIADKTYLNGTLIGNEGYFPPEEFTAWNTVRLYEIPETILNYESENELLVEIWVNGEGSIVSSPFIGTHEDVKKASSAARFWNSQLNFLIAFFMVIIAFYHFMIWLRHKVESENLFFAIINFVSAAYMSVFFIPELPSVITSNLNFLIFQKLVSSGLVFFMVFFIPSFVNAFFKQKDHIAVLCVRWICLVIPVIAILFAKDYVHLRAMRTWTQLFLIPPMLYVFFLVIKGVIQKKKDALPLLWGFSPFIFTGLLDVILHNFAAFYNLPYFTSIGWQLVVIALLFILAGRFSNARKEAEYLNVHLKDEVEERTKELSESNQQLTQLNEKLELAKQTADNDMKLAVQVQQSFYPRRVPQLKDWEIAYTFKPMSGVSGDLYDFFYTGTKLDGIALFDVSGHGISSGLVTMLAKTVIARNFTSDMSVKLGTVMKNINNAIVSEKGDVENYLTGLLLRADGNKVQLINAGHPAVFFRSAKNGKCYPVQLKKKDEEGSSAMSGGIIGIPGFDVDFSAIQFNMSEGDALIMYTDCLSESHNKNGDEFTQDGVAKAFAESGNGSAQSKLDNVLGTFNNFTSSVPLKDDLTVLVLQKK